MCEFEDDLTGPPKEEPNCFDCCDSGIEQRRGRNRACRQCCPSRMRVRWWTLQGWFAARRWWRQFDSEDAPF